MKTWYAKGMPKWVLSASINECSLNMYTLCVSIIHSNSQMGVGRTLQEAKRLYTHHFGNKENRVTWVLNDN